MKSSSLKVTVCGNGPASNAQADAEPKSLCHSTRNGGPAGRLLGIGSVGQALHHLFTNLTLAAATSGFVPDASIGVRADAGTKVERIYLHAPSERELGLRLVLNRAELCVGQEIGDRATLVAPSIEGGLAQKDVVPLCAAPMVGG